VSGVCRVEGQRLICSGSLDFASVPDIEANLKISAALSEVDVTAVDKIDSAGVAFLVWLMNAPKIAQSKPKLVGLNENSRRLLDVAGLSSILNTL
jgi:anti-anti-sigma factor